MSVDHLRREIAKLREEAEYLDKCVVNENIVAWIVHATWLHQMAVKLEKLGEEHERNQAQKRNAKRCVDRCRTRKNGTTTHSISCPNWIARRRKEK
jgi:hypothetical protein